MHELNQKVVIVTGAGSGLGRAICAYSAQQRAIVAVTDKDPDKARATTDLVTAKGGQASCWTLDVTDAGQVEAVVSSVFDSYGRIDYLFNNAGVALNGEFQDISVEDWHLVMDVNFWGVIHCCRAVYPLMMKQGSGHIINVSSLAGLIPGGLMTAYGAAKHAVVGFSYNLRAEAQQYGIRVTALCPGYLDTPMHVSAKNVSSYVARHDKEYLAREHAYPTAAQSVKHMMHGVLRNQAVAVAPRVQLPLWWAHRALPSVAPWLWQRVIRHIKRKHADPAEPARSGNPNLHY